MMLRPGQFLFARPIEDGVYLVDDPSRSQASKDYLVRRFLGEAERLEYEALSDARKDEWLYGRIVAKDATRGFLFDRGVTPVFPIQVRVGNTESGSPTVAAPWDGDLHISIAHKGHLALAAVREGQPVGVDIERIEPRDQSFERVAYRSEELELLSAAADRNEWLTRLWCAKECAAKARGTGMTNPRSFVVAEIRGEALLVDERWVQTRRQGEVIIGWTEAL